jgi:hypothetical protein
VLAEPQQEPLGCSDAILREGEDGVLLRVRRNDVGVVAEPVRRLEIPAELR